MSPNVCAGAGGLLSGEARACPPGENVADAPVHLHPAGLHRAALGGQIHCGLSRLSLPAAAHGASEAVPPAQALPGQGTAGGKRWWRGVAWAVESRYLGHLLVCLTLGKLSNLQNSYFYLYDGAGDRLYFIGLLGGLDANLGKALNMVFGARQGGAAVSLRKHLAEGQRGSMVLEAILSCLSPTGRAFLAAHKYSKVGSQRYSRN